MSILILSILTIALLLTSSITGIVTDTGGNPYPYTTLIRRNVDIYGVLVYINTIISTKPSDSAVSIGVNIVIVLPLFVFGIFQYRRGTLMGRLLLASLFTYVAWIYLLGVMEICSMPCF